MRFVVHRERIEYGHISVPNDVEAETFVAENLHLITWEGVSGYSEDIGPVEVTGPDYEECPRCKHNLAEQEEVVCHGCGFDTSRP